MAGRGPTPKSDPVRRNRRPAFVELAGPPVDPPNIPVGEWLPQTVEWWETWCEAPQASQFGGTAWQRLKMLVPLVDLYFIGGAKDLLTEIRLSEKSLGASPEDMQRLRWHIAGRDPDNEPAPKKRSKRGKDPRKSYLKSV